MKNQSGYLTLDFLFGFLLTWGFFIIFLALSLSMSVVSVVQYMTFAAARNYLAGDMTPERQQQMAEAKFSALASNPALRRWFTGGWFTLKTSELQVGDMTKLAPAYPESNPKRNTFIGVRVPLTANVLDINIPFYGSTASSDGGGFSTRIGSYLLREPTAQECQNFMDERAKAIVGFTTAGSASTNDIGNFEDNGC